MSHFDMSQTMIFSVVALLAFGLAAAYLVFKQRQHHHYRTAFGPEYDRTLEQYGNQARAERELGRREKRLKKIEIRPLTGDEQRGFSEAWSLAERRFIDDPRKAIRDADRLMVDIMRTRGYPMSDFDQRIADLSVDHANVIEHYRAAQALSTGNTEDLRQAVIHYRALFAELLG